VKEEGGGLSGSGEKRGEKRRICGSSRGGAYAEDLLELEQGTHKATGKQTLRSKRKTSLERQEGKKIRGTWQRGKTDTATVNERGKLKRE